MRELVGLAVLVVVGLGCAEPESEPSEICNETTTVLGPTDMTPFGFTAQELLSQVVGDHVTTLHWMIGESYADYVMPDTTVELAIGVSYSGGGLRYVESTPVPGCEGECDVLCTPRVEFDGAVTFSTADGVFDELWDTVLTATTASEAEFTIELHPDETQGSLSAASFVLEDDFIDDDLTLQLLGVGGRVGPTSTAGGLWLQFGLPDNTGWAYGSVGEWPPGGG